VKIAIVSDTHDNIPNFKKVIDFLNKEKVDLMLHCGDICNQETIDEAVKSFKGEIKFVRGNGDYDLHNIPEKMEIELDNKKIAFIHYPDKARELAESKNSSRVSGQEYDLVFYGHTHRPWEEKVGNPSTGSGQVCRLVNPGELAGQRYKPCFALYDTKTDKLELKILEKI